ncbi:calcium-binding protein PBP1-like [Malania oleifera]|uniref:calcium-binding protein PBP1-like n=1 Tax=Malania oleifera TaxID=397392 RepID=UPI0025AE3980|nr:calcium-binding protein PBP1-like [Malania oleifera]
MAGNRVVFEDYFPAMVEILGVEGFMKELCKGFRLLMDVDKELITFESLQRNSAVLGMEDTTDDQLRCMLREGDLDGDGALSLTEFCILMFRLSPDLMDESRKWLHEILFNAL